MVCANQAWNLVNFRAGLILALRDAGFDVIALAPAEPEMERRLAALGCRFVAVPVDAMGLSPWRDLVTLLAIRRAIRVHRPAAWLSWTIKPNVYGVLAAWSCGVKAFPNVSGLGTAFIRRNLVTRFAKALYRTAFRHAAKVFFQNADDAALFVEEQLVRSLQVGLLPGSGIDPGYWKAPRSERPGRRTFLMIARVVADKGAREYAEAARLLREQWPDARCLLMGQLDVANRTAIGRAEVAQWESEGAIEYLAPQDDVRPAMAAADFIVLPSYREGLSRVLLEAAAMGRPIVTCDVPGCRDVVRDGENGYLCAPRDAGSLHAAMARAAQTDDADWHRMADAGRERVLAEFSIEKVTKLYLDALMAENIVPVARDLE